MVALGMLCPLCGAASASKPWRKFKPARRLSAVAKGLQLGVAALDVALLSSMVDSAEQAAACVAEPASLAG